MTTAAIIPARAGSKRLPNKNLAELCGKPLLVWTVEQALAAKHVDVVYVSTDSGEIAMAAMAAGALMIERPPELSADSTCSEEVLMHAVRVIHPTPDRIVFLQPTSPIRQPTDIDDACELLDRWPECDSVYSGCVLPGYTHPFLQARREDDNERKITENGSIYVIDTDTFQQTQSRFGTYPVAHIMAVMDSFQVDYAEDLALIEQLMPIRLEVSCAS